MDIVIALLPALFLGATSVITTKIGGHAVQGTLGMTYGAVVFGIVLMLAYVAPNAGWDFALNPRIWVVGLLSGVFWSVGSAGQFTAIRYLGVTLAMPLSTAGQIVTNAIMAALILGEWTTGRMWAFGLLAVALVCAGALCTSIPDSPDDAADDAAAAAANPAMTEAAAVEAARDGAGAAAGAGVGAAGAAGAGTGAVTPAARRSGAIALVLSTLGFMLYFLLPNLLAKIGFISPEVHDAPQGTGVYYMTAVIAPQSLGMLVGALVITLAVTRRPALIVERHSIANIITGIVWAIGNVLIFISCANPHIGQAVATTFSQLCVIVSVIGGIVVLHERHTRRQMWFIALGTLLIAGGALIMGNLSTL